VLAQTGFWAISMRGMMVTTQGEDYVIFAEARGLGGVRRFFAYGIRNAMLPQVTGLAIALAHVIGGAVLVEVVFGYPGIGKVLYLAIRSYDYFLLYGVVFVVILSIALATFLVDVLYPLLDPRIRYQAG
jgi:peptide/nickel transport system permease protein